MAPFSGPWVSHLFNACLVVPWALEEAEEFGVLKAQASLHSVPPGCHLAMLWLRANGFLDTQSTTMVHWLVDSLLLFLDLSHLVVKSRMPFLALCSPLFLALRTSEIGHSTEKYI